MGEAGTTCQTFSLKQNRNQLTSQGFCYGEETESFHAADPRHYFAGGAMQLEAGGHILTLNIRNQGRSSCTVFTGVRLHSPVVWIVDLKAARP